MAESGTRSCGRSRAWHRARWREHVVAQAGSGLSAAAYCREHGLRKRSFYRWRTAFRAEGTVCGASGSVEDHAEVSSAPVFAELRLAPETGPVAALAIEVVLPGERRLRLGPGFDAETLRRAVSVLESLSC